MAEQVIVLYDYNKKEQDELTLRKGQVITVSEKHDDGWWKGTNDRGDHGAFPENYVKVLAPGDLPPQPEPQRKDDVELKVEVDEREEVKAKKQNVPRRKLSGMIAKLLNYTYLFSLAVTLIFMIPLLASHDGQVAWSIGEDTEDTLTTTTITTTTWAGLLNIRQFASNSDGQVTLTYYDSDECQRIMGDGTCNKCNEAGKAVLSFVVLSFVLLLASLGITTLRMVGLDQQGPCKLLTNRLVTGILNGVIALFFFFQWTIWAGGCNAPLQDDNTLKEANTNLAGGWSLAFLSFLFMASVSTIDGLFLLMGEEKEPDSVKPHVGPGDADQSYDAKGVMKGDHSALPTDAKVEDYQEPDAGAPGQASGIPEEEKKEPAHDDVMQDEALALEVADNDDVPTNTYGGPSVAEDNDPVENKVVAV
eukprot:CAMPEP_0167788118 /NCGR_PEP_ID=MMETSP0111_2-20121227/9841_1 /TAXON_ID=91324 /ORGANISM="Lotharella globosa, Strain CCCM811" /LENGTH=418 /DNA_ID=CAMNT_0007679917 /DNA_START=27 /DNA_END=1283 /DNA_ORIENTATION=+